jgi:hypothetical protein
MDAAPSIDDLVLRYLVTFGPASVSDIRVWSWLTGLREVVDRLRPRLRTFRDDVGRELFDVEDGLIADEEVPAPVRFLPQYDNVFLSHDDRSRILIEGLKIDDLIWNGGVLVDGYVGATWRIRREKRGKSATMTVTSFEHFTGPQRAAIEAEGERLFAFLASDAERREIQLVESP